MDDTEDDARYTPNSYGVDQQQDYGSSHRKRILRNATYTRDVDNQYVDDEDEDGDDEEYLQELGVEDGENNENNGIQCVGKDEDEDEDEDDDDQDEDVDEEEEDGDNQKNFSMKSDDDDDDDLERHPKKRKLKSLVSSYEFAPRVPAAPPVAAPSLPKPSVGGRNPLTDWTERETFVLLDAWGDKFLQRGKKSLRSDEWQEVAENVSELSKIERTDTQCRNRLDTLKKKYKSEKIKLAEAGGGTSKWIYFKKMDLLMSTSAQHGGLSCGLDSGECVFTNPKVNANRANGLDEMKDSPAKSETVRDEDDSDGLPPKKRRFGRDCNERSSFRLLADSIHKFSEIYEKIENTKRQQMLELEKMRMDFQRDLEMQKRQIIERAQAEIAKLQQGGEGGEEDNISVDSA